MKSRGDVEQNMNLLLQRLGLTFRVVWTPDPVRKSHGNIDLAQRIIHIYNEDLQGAWETLGHEIIELKLTKLTNIYRSVINSLIDLIEKHVYKEKESLIEALPKIMQSIEEAKADVCE